MLDPRRKNKRFRLLQILQTSLLEEIGQGAFPRPSQDRQFEIASEESQITAYPATVQNIGERNLKSTALGTLINFAIDLSPSSVPELLAEAKVMPTRTQRYFSSSNQGNSGYGPNFNNSTPPPPSMGPKP